MAYQGRVLVSILTLTPAILLVLRKRKVPYVSTRAEEILTNWFRGVIRNAGLVDGRRFISRTRFKAKRYLGAGGIGLFRNTLWVASTGRRVPPSASATKIQVLADRARAKVYRQLGEHR